MAVKALAGGHDHGAGVAVHRGALGWIGIRSHPGPAATASYGSAAIPPWIGDWLSELAA